MARLQEPDTGYAWVIVFACCMINTILAGLSRMTGLLYVAVIDEYGVPRKQASVPFLVRNAVRYLTGPLAGVLCQRYGIRIVTFCGGLVASLGSVLCFFAPTVEWISVFYGGIHGVGMAMSNILFRMLVNQYFEKYRATATGIVLSGACLGSFVFPFLIECLLDNYGLSGCFLILGGMFLNVLPPSLFLKSPSWIENPEAYSKQRALIEGNKMVEPSVYATTQKNIEECVIGVRSTKILKSYACKDYKDESNVVCKSYRTYKSNFLGKPNKLKALKENVDNEAKANSTSTVYHIHGNEENEPVKPLANEANKIVPLRKPNGYSSILEITKNIAVLYKNPLFVLISVSVAGFMWLYIPILTVVIDFGRDKGFPTENEKFLIHALTIGDLSGRLCFGWVTDKKFLSLPVYMMVTFFCQGLFVCLLPFAVTFPLYMVALILYGITAGILPVCFPVLVHKYVDGKYQSIGMGCYGLISGIISFGIPPVIGYFRDNIGSYNGLFFMIGLISIICGCLWLLEPFLLKLTNHKTVNNEEES